MQGACPGYRRSHRTPTGRREPGPYRPTRGTRRGSRLSSVRSPLATRAEHTYSHPQISDSHPEISALTVGVNFRKGRSTPAAATIAGFAFSPVTARSFRELTTTITHLREVLGNTVYESRARAGATMTMAAMANYAFDQIDQARIELERAS